MNYWEECISEAFEDAGIKATDEQIATVAYWVEGAHETHGMAHGYDAIPNPTLLENKRLKKELEKEKEKDICPECNGKGFEVTSGPVHSSLSDCFRCKGKRFIYY